MIRIEEELVLGLGFIARFFYTKPKSILPSQDIELEDIMSPNSRTYALIHHPIIRWDKRVFRTWRLLLILVILVTLEYIHTRFYFLNAYALNFSSQKYIQKRQMYTWKYWVQPQIVNILQRGLTEIKIDNDSDISLFYYSPTRGSGCRGLLKGFVLFEGHLKTERWSLLSYVR